MQQVGINYIFNGFLLCFYLQEEEKHNLKRERKIAVCYVADRKLPGLKKGRKMALFP